MEDKNDQPLDCLERRDRAFKILEYAKLLTTERLQYSGMRTTDRILLSEGMVRVVLGFETLEKGFIAPQAAINPEMAARGYAALEDFMYFVAVISPAGAFIEAREHQKRSSAGGKAERRVVVPKWASEALPITKDLMASFPNSRPADLLRRLKKKIAIQRTDRAVLNQFSRWEAAGEITFSKNSLKFKHASTS